MDLQPDLLIVGGGDGSISEAARRLAYRDMALGILPLGTTNNFAGTLGLPLNLAGATDVLAAGKVADVDLGRAATPSSPTWSAPACPPTSPRASGTSSSASSAGLPTRSPRWPRCPRPVL